MKKWMKTWFVVAVFLLMLTTNVSAVSYKAGGDCGDDLKWSLDYDGNLRIYGEGPMWDSTGGFGWDNYKGDIRTITVEKGVTSLGGKFAFTGCNNLTTVNLPDTLTSLGQSTFWGCSSLISIHLPDSLKSIGYGVFRDCLSLKSINIPNTVTSIGDDAFQGSGITSASIPSSVTYIGSGAFSSCPNLQTVTINGTTTGNQSFRVNPVLTTVKMGSGVKTIGDYTFMECTNLKNLTIGPNVTSIGGNAFEKCTSLKEVVIPDKVQTMTGLFGSYAFLGCTSLEKVSIGMGMTELGISAFEGCSSLKEIRFYGSAPYFQGQDTFKGCGTIIGYYPENDKTWDPSVLNAHGAANIDWREWTIPLNSFAATLKSVTTISNGIEVKWNKMPNANGYIIERRVGNGAYVVVKNITKNSITTWKDSSVKNGYRYTYRVYGTRGTEKSKVSNAKYQYYLTKNTLSSLSKNGKAFTAKWKANTSATGYHLQYARNNKFSGAKSVKITNRKTISKKINFGVKGKCYVRVRTYKTVNGVNFFSDWSNVRSLSF